MQSNINLNFTDVSLYRKAVGDTVLARLCKNVKKSEIFWLEIGPGANSSLIDQLASIGGTGNGSYFVEPNQSFVSKLELSLPHAKIINGKIEDEVSSLPNEYFDRLYANFSLHWSNNLSSVLNHLYRAMKPKGLIGLTITDQSRSFWAMVNKEFQLLLPGCDLFHAPEAKTLVVEGWKDALIASKFALVEDIVFSGTASFAKDPQEALAGFKKAVGSNYLKLSAGVSIEQAELCILKVLSVFQNSSGGIAIPASGRGFIAERN